MCAYALSLSGVPRVIFGAENDKFGGNGSVLSLHRFPTSPFTSTQGPLRDEAVKLLQ